MSLASHGYQVLVQELAANNICGFISTNVGSYRKLVLPTEAVRWLRGATATGDKSPLNDTHVESFSGVVREIIAADSCSHGLMLRFSCLLLIILSVAVLSEDAARSMCPHHDTKRSTFSQHGELLVGKRIEVLFGGSNGGSPDWYTGTITAFLDNGQHRIAYDDGDVQLHILDQVRFRLLDGLSRKSETYMWSGARSGLHLNLGCGRNHRQGFVNVDSDPSSGADVLHDLERIPWPFPTSSASRIELTHVLEHVGGSWGAFSDVLREIYRVAEPGATIAIAVPHHLHPSFTADPTHVRPITVDLWPMLSRMQCQDWIRIGASNTPLAFMLGVDFRHISTAYTLDKEHSEFLLKRGLVTREELNDVRLFERLSLLFSGLMSQIDVVLRVDKTWEEKRNVATPVS